MGWIAVVAVFAAFFLLIVLPVALIAAARRRARNDSLSALASAMGFSYCHDLPGGETPWIASGTRVYQSPAAEQFLGQFADCPVFSSGSFRGVHNVMQGRRWDRDWLVFDFHHWTQSRASESKPAQTTCVVVRAQSHLGRLSVEPRLPLIGRVAALVQPATIVELGDPEFDAKFLVRSASPDDVFRVLQPALREYLVSLWHSRRGRWYRRLRIEGDLIIVVEPGLASPEHIDQMMEIARRIVEKAEFVSPETRR